MFKNIKIVTVMFLILALFGVMQMITNGFYFKSVRENQTNVKIEERYSLRRTHLHNLWAYLLQARSSLNRAALRINMHSEMRNMDAQTEELLALAGKQLASAEEKYAEFQQVHQQLNHLDHENLDSKTLVDTYQELYQKLQELKSLLTQRDIQGALAQPTQHYQDRFEKAYDLWIKTNRDQSQENSSESEHNYSVSLMLAGLMMVLIVIALAAMWVVLQRILLRPLDRVIAHIKRITEGDLTAKIEVTTHNEMGQLAESLRDMQRSLATTVRDVRSGADIIYTSASKISLDSGDLASRTEQQAASLEQTAASMEELTATVKQNADNARQASQLALSASETAQRGGKVVDGVVKTMSEIADSSKKIADIISVIDGIAFQTNILALNAAVEAARAGEQGRGFAVVAGEVRSLAQRSAQAAKEIKDLIVDSVSCVDTGAELVESAGETMSEIVSAVNRVTDIMGEIAAASDEQSRGIEQVGQAVTEMDGVTQQNASLVEASAAAAAALEEQASRLGKAVAVFTLPGGENSIERSGTPALTLKPGTVKEKNTATAEDDWVTF
ncbi:methyl-accepting chemotaxis protein [Mixta tenebrionis]|uniref:HAMP domain-containing protein n=1 Tax=Mixta tenebrionis TaxID=2562439 RepID=A0A506VBT7_9GAMM|nr:methyl-accepting chemotaxis protein [Mixta tenebrionis]TPW43105.1 HAMP domain-containing protein [Mixta tenebrionis]